MKWVAAATWRAICHHPFLVMSGLIQIMSLWFILAALQDVLYSWMALVEWVKFQLASSIFTLADKVDGAVRSGVSLQVNDGQRSVFVVNAKRERDV